MPLPCKTAVCFLRKSHCPCGAHGSLLSALISRQCSSKSQQQTKAAPKRSTFRPAPDSTHDWIGPPDLVSNLRPIVYCIPENETELEKCLRNLRQETEDWNHEFWTKQNITFRKEKGAYMTSMLKAQGLSLRDEQGRKRTLNSEEMAVFYKSFLDNNIIRHSNYNKEWYKRNFTITLYMARVVLHSIWRNITERLRVKKKNTPAT